VRVTLERLRKAASEAHRAIADAEGVGLDPDVMLETIRTEYLDWPQHLNRMQAVQELLAASGARTRLDTLILVDDPLATEEQIQALETDQGYMAFVLGRHIRDCPYHRASPAAASWREGYLNAKDDYGRDD
jgi:ribosome modulation factor